MIRFHAAARRGGRPLLLTLVLFLGATVALSAQSAGAPSPVTLSVKQAVQEALSHSGTVQGAVAAWQSAKEKVLEARLKMLPSLSLTGSYTRLSKLPSADTTLTLMPGVSFNLSSPLDAYNLGASLRYPVFTGFRLLEAAKIAELQSTGKELAIRIVRNALSFEVERAYWESVRASASVDTLKQNLDLVGVLRQQVRDEVTQGFATQSDLLSAQQHYNQAQIALNDAIAGRDQAFLALASLTGADQTGAALAASGQEGFLTDAAAAYHLTTDPAAPAYQLFSKPLDPTHLVAQALADRPEVQTAEVGVQTAQHAVKAAQGGLYPTLSLIGDYTYANPNQRVPFATSSKFTGTWDVGVAVNIDLGKLPGSYIGSKAAAMGVTGAKAQAEAERTKVVLDVRKSLLSFQQAKADLELTKRMVPQAQEDLRVTKSKLDQGVAKRSDVLRAQLALLRAQLGVTNAEVSLRIAGADLARAIGLPPA